MRWVGLSGVTSSGCSASSFLSRSTSRSYLQVGDLRGRFDVVFPVVMADFLAEPGDFGGRIGGHRRISGKGSVGYASA